MGIIGIEPGIQNISTVDFRLGSTPAYRTGRSLAGSARVVVTSGIFSTHGIQNAQCYDFVSQNPWTYEVKKY